MLYPRQYQTQILQSAFQIKCYRNSWYRYQRLSSCVVLYSKKAIKLEKAFIAFAATYSGGRLSIKQTVYCLGRQITKCQTGGNSQCVAYSNRCQKASIRPMYYAQTQRVISLSVPETAIIIQSIPLQIYLQIYLIAYIEAYTLTLICEQNFQRRYRLYGTTQQLSRTTSQPGEPGLWTVNVQLLSQQQYSGYLSSRIIVIAVNAFRNLFWHASSAVGVLRAMHGAFRLLSRLHSLWNI